MRLRTRLILLLVVAAIVPLLVTGLAAERTVERHHLRQTHENTIQRAESLAVFVRTWLDARTGALALSAHPFDLGSLEARKREGFLGLVLAQNPDVEAAALLDEAGRVITGPAMSVPEPAPVLDAFLRGAAGQVIAGDDLVGPPIRRAGGRAPAVPVVVPVGEGTRLAALLSLQALQEPLARQARGPGAAVLLDEDGRPLAGSGEGLIDVAVLSRLGGEVEGGLSYPLEDGSVVLGAFVRVPPAGWTVALAVPRETVMKGGLALRDRMRFTYGLAVLLAAVLGAIGARQVARPVLVLRDAARRVAEGEVGLTVPTRIGITEVAELARAFNHMSLRLASAAREIARKNDAITAFNRELQERVEERTRELLLTRDRLAAASRMAAVAQMGAGLAHELNNPLAGILGMAQVALARGPGERVAEPLRRIEAEARRCRDVLAILRRFSEVDPSMDRERVDLARVVREVVDLVAGGLQGRGVRLEPDRLASVEVLVDVPRMAQALTWLLRSLGTTLEPGGVLHLRTWRDAGEAILEVRSAGVPRSDRDDWQASGMGFWLARRFVEEHGGRLTDAPGGVEVRLPVALGGGEASPE